ncbi:MAG: molybdopterin-dependent oxidoreductase [Gaiellaceae bacterium]
MSTPELVTVTIDGREVQAPKGAGLVETAMQAGIEIPVFCYEPRLGPAVGACRMCLVEIEGMPKLQAGCTLTAQDGLVVRTAQTSAQAAEGQNATLEFLLVNHPLDCPVCDKGGECPLQDLTFRWGPGRSRMTFMKRTFDKPIPISPLIALDRERCILCYRCTRFSENVAEDGQLIAKNRGAQSMIATFQDEPYRAPFSGNVIELCPVGALTSTTYRFGARPWEIQNVPSVCALCPVGCNITVTTREGKVKRVLGRNHPEVDEGWLCDKGRFAYPSLYAGDRITAPLRKAGPRRFEAVSWEEALGEAERFLTEARGHIVTALSGSETVEQAYALGRLLRGLGAHSAVLAEPTTTALDAFRGPLSTIRDAQLVVIVGDEPVAERAPIVDLWLRAAARNGAGIVTVGMTGSVQAPAGSATAACRRMGDRRSALGRRLRDSERVVLIWSGSGGGGGAELARLAGTLGFAEREGCAAFYLPTTPNGRGVADAWAAAGDADEQDPEPIGLLVVSGDEAVVDPNVRALADRAERVLVFAMYRRPLLGWVDLVLPGTSYLERDGTTVNLEGRLQRLRRAAIPPATDEVTVIAELATRLGIEVPRHVPELFAELSERAYGGFPFSAVGELAPLPLPARPAPEPPAPTVETETTDGSAGLRLVTYRPLFSGPDVERVPELSFQRPEREVALSVEDAAARGIAGGQTVTVRSNGTTVALRAMVRRELASGVAVIAEEHCAGLARYVEISPSHDAPEGSVVA